MHLHGAASGGPVFNTSGHVFGIASSSYDGMTDISLVTPIISLLDIVIPNALDRGDGRGLQNVTVGELASLGAVAIKNLP
jgi:hypothetical protein